MSIRQLPEVRALARPQNYQWDTPGELLARWTETPLAVATDDSSITIFDVIGEDFMGGGVTAKRIAGALRVIGEQPVTVKINSPGGDLFEGVAIYNLLRAHKAKVTVEVLGMAASAASIIAMAGDEIIMGLGTFMMIHNGWGVVVGNSQAMLDGSKIFAEFDAAMADIYVARTSMKRATIEAMMDAETFMGPQEAVKNGFADKVSEDISAPAAHAADNAEVMAKRRIDALLAKEGLPRSERRRLMKTASGTQDAAAAHSAMPDAGAIAAGIQQLIHTLKS